MALMTLNRPETLNALNAALRKDISNAVLEVREDDEIRALACDLRVGSEKTSFKTVFPERSLSPDAGMTFFLPRIIGYSRAADLIFTSRRVDAEEAYRLGLLDRLVEHEKLLEEPIGLARQIAFWPPMAIRSSKRVLQRNLECDLEQALRNETVGLSRASNAPHDMKESRLSWVEKRPPVFTGQ